LWYTHRVNWTFVFILFIGLKSYGVHILDWTEILPVEYIRWDGILLADGLWSQYDLEKKWKCIFEKYIWLILISSISVFEWVDYEISKTNGFYSSLTQVKTRTLPLRLLYSYSCYHVCILCHHLKMILENISCIMKIIYWKLTPITHGTYWDFISHLFIHAFQVFTFRRWWKIVLMIGVLHFMFWKVVLEIITFKEFYVIIILEAL
jgi:hypothetical protein